MLNTIYYNERLTQLKTYSDFSGAINSFIEVIDAYDAAVISYIAYEAAKGNTPLAAQEALGDYIRRGSGSAVKGVGMVVGAIFKLGLWTISMIKKMLVFAVKGFQGTIGGSVRTIEKIANKIPEMQDTKIGKGVSVKTITRIREIMEEHTTDIDITVPSGNIAAAKISFINAFNNKMKDDAKINAKFQIAKAPKPFGKATLSEAGYTGIEAFRSAAEEMGKAENILNEQLKTIKEVGGKINSIVRSVKAKGYSDKTMKKADSVTVLSAAYHSAVLANDLKYLNATETVFKVMVQDIVKKSGAYVGEDTATP